MGTLDEVVAGAVGGHRAPGAVVAVSRDGQVADVIAGAPLIHPPGERWSYCNAGYVVLGRLVEVLDGRPWDDALAACSWAAD